MFTGRAQHKNGAIRIHRNLRASLGHWRVKGAMVAIAAAALLVANVEAAQAHGTYPSQHFAAAVCYRTNILGTWTVMSNVYMNRADGFPATVYGSAVGTGPYFTGGSWGLIDSNSEQWLYYQVVVGTQLPSGAWTWIRGNWIRAKDALGDGTDGLSTEFQRSDGTWVRTGYTATSSPWDVSLANGWLSGGIGLSAGRKYVYGHMWWGPIYNSKNQQVFAPYDHWEPIGYMNCG